MEVTTDIIDFMEVVEVELIFIIMIIKAVISLFIIN